MLRCPFSQLKVALAPCIEGLILLDRLCYLKEQVRLLMSRSSALKFFQILTEMKIIKQLQIFFFITLELGKQKTYTHLSYLQLLIFIPFC